MELSKSEIDRLGDRLRAGPPSPSDLQMLSDYRLSFRPAFELVQSKLQEQGLSPTGRRAKSTNSIVDKLRRQKTRLSRMQDIAGCRIVVEGLLQQDDLVKKLPTIFPSVTVMDRRANPSHGYRAVHVIVRVDGKRVEIQTRTLLQHRWAEASEKAADTVDPAIKYGGGDMKWKDWLASMSRLMATVEGNELDIATLEAKLPGVRERAAPMVKVLALDEISLSFNDFAAPQLTAAIQSNPAAVDALYARILSASISIKREIINSIDTKLASLRASET